MLDIARIHQAIDAWILTNPPEEYHVKIHKDDKQRPYLGLSGIGHECWKYVWLQWRHCIKPVFPSRIHRLFRRGDLEEYRLVWLLRGIGFEIFEVDEDGKQYSVSDFEGHLKGNLDGVAIIPDHFWLEGAKPHPVLLEFKSANDNKFKECKSVGVQEFNSKYFYQQQGYCGYKELEGSLFCIVNKNDDEQYFEYVPARKKHFRNVVEKAETIIGSQTPPDRIANASPTYWNFKTKSGCKYCDGVDVCFGKAASQKLCRTCRFAEPAENASWVCVKGRKYGSVCSQYKDIARQ